MVSRRQSFDVLGSSWSGRAAALAGMLLAFASLAPPAAAQGGAIPQPPVPRLHGQWAGPYELPLDWWGEPQQQYCTGEIVHMAVLPPPIDADPPLRTNHQTRVMFI